MKIVFEDIYDFNPTHIFDCGQCFRWRRISDDNWIGIVGTGSDEARIAKVAFLPDGKSKAGARTKGKVEVTILSGANSNMAVSKATSGKERDFWFNYLDLGRDYGKVKQRLSRGDDVMKLAIKSGDGIRILNQDLWETIVSFIISQNNNIPRIKGCIERLSEVTGEGASQYKTSGVDEVVQAGLSPFALPSPEKLASLTVEDLDPVKLGYRARYLIESAREVCERGLPKNYEEVLALTGVGPKVANCIGLFGLHLEDSFPIDVWVKRVMHELYGFDEDDMKGMQEYASEHFKELSGFAQQYLFYYIREREKNS